jgi:hypothetical protein|uniref:Uncharacterized protein n=1 Tax=viral metagenome TaxID=1070528 RepID=A0A6C0AMC4_9ZZZZ
MDVYLKNTIQIIKITSYNIMQLFRILLYLFHFTSFLILANQITVKNYDLAFNKTYYGNVSILCKNQGACNMTKIYCDTGNCYIEATGNNKGQLNNLIIDARNIRKGYKFELKCGSQTQNTVGNTNCNNVKVLCPLHRGATCKCTNCNYREVKFYCELGIGVYCTGSRVIPSWNKNNIWCDSGESNNPYGGYGGYGGSGKYICDDIDWGIASCEATYTNPTISSSLYNFAPNDKCIAFQTTFYSSYYNEDYTQITTHSCRETINASNNEYKYHLPICVKYISKPDNIPDLKQYFNITRIIIKNKTNIINQTNWIDKQIINLINKTRWINKTNIIEKINLIDKVIINWIDKIRWINKTNIIEKIRIIIINKTKWIYQIRINWTNKTNEIRKIINQTLITRVENKENYENNKNSTKFELDLNNIFVLGGLSFGGLIILSCTFYVSWKCWLQEKVERMIMTWLIGEEGVNCLERVGCFNEYFEALREIKIKKNDIVEYYGLTPEEIAVCKETKAINKIKYLEALNIRFEELAKHAVRPRDSYHKELFKNIIKEPKKNIEMCRQDIPIKEEEPPILEQEKMIINILPGTPRRRLPRRSMEI